MVTNQDMRAALVALAAGLLVGQAYPHPARAPSMGKKPAFVLKGHTASVNGLALSPDGCLLATGSWDRTIRLWDASRHAQAHCLRGHRDTVFRLAFSPDGRRLASAGYDSTVLLWDPATGQELHRLAAQSKMVFGVAFSPDGQVLAACGNSGVIDRWEVASGEALASFKTPAGQISNLAFSPDGRFLAAAGYDGVIHVLDAASGKERQRLTGHGHRWLHFVAFSPDGRMLASAGEDKTVRLWEAASGKERLRLRGHNELVGSVTFSADGRSLISTSYDQTIRFWDTATGQECFRIEEEGGWPRAVVLPPGGRTLVSASDAGVVYGWDIPGRLPHGPSPLGKLSGKDRAALWEQLAETNAERPYQVICSLAASPDELLGLLREHLRPGLGVEGKRVAELIAQLDDEEFSVRQRASQRLRQMGERIEPLLRKALDEDPTPEVRRRIKPLLEKMRARALTPEELREVRVVEALEMAGTAEARGLLRTLADGASTALLTREAMAGLQRLSRRDARRP